MSRVDVVFQNFAKSFNSKVNAETKVHLKNVYSCLAFGMMTASAGAYLQLTQPFLRSTFMMIVSSLAAFGFLMYVMCTKSNTSNESEKKKRFGCFLGFTACSGIGLGPLLELAIIINPSLIVTAFMLTTLLFVSFTFAAIFAKNGQWIFIGGGLMSLLSTLITLSLANIFFGSKLLFDVSLYLGLVLMCGFILYDTQLIMEKCKNGDKDFVSHSVDLFIDFIGVFRRVLIILQSREAEKSNKKKE